MSDLLAHSAPGDGELLFRLSRGDEPAYRLLHDRHQAAVFRVALVMMRTSSDAEEIAAIAFFELWRKRNKVRLVDDSVLPWLLATTSRIAKNSLRSRRRYRRLLGRIPHDGGVADHDDEVTRAMDAMNMTHPVRAALLELNPRDASIVLLCIVHDVAVTEAAVVLGIPEGTVRSRLSRVRARLRGAHDEYAPRAEEANA